MVSDKPRARSRVLPRPTQRRGQFLRNANSLIFGCDVALVIEDIGWTDLPRLEAPLEGCALPAHFDRAFSALGQIVALCSGMIRSAWHRLLKSYLGLMGAFHCGALTVLVTLNNLYPMRGAKTRNLAPSGKGHLFTAVVGHLDALVLVRKLHAHSEHLFEADPMPNGIMSVLRCSTLIE